MALDYYNLIGLLAGVLSLAGLLVYARSVVAGSTKPSRATWFIWTLNSLLLLTSYRSSGAEETVWLAGGYAVGCVIISILTIKRGTGGWSWLDRVCLGGAVVGALLWWITGSPLTAFVATLVIDLLGVLPTIQKSWKHPEEEDRLAWALMFVGGFLSLLAIEDWWSLTIISYPLQITITTAVIVWFLVRPRRHLA